MYKVPRGTRDILPQEQAYWRYIEGKASAICQLHGYQRIDTPIFEDAGLFVRTIGEETDIVEKEMYSFEDRGGARMTLRPEGTAPICRAYIEHGMHNLPQPLRLYYTGPAFRYERPQAGRYRQHNQFGCEVLGDGDPALDAEVIHMAWLLFTDLGLTCLVLQLNSIGCKLCRPGHLRSLKGYYMQHRKELCPDCKMRLERNPMRLLDCKKLSCLHLAEAAPKSADHLCPECSEHFDRAKRYLGLLGLPFEINHKLVRGLDYYTGTVFEIQPRAGGAQGALGGGGRYDDLIEELGGKPTPAVGFALGMERIILNLKDQGIVPPSIPQPKVLVAYLGDEAKDRALEYAEQLWREGIGAILARSGRSLKAQLRQANAMEASYAIIVGETELLAGTVQLRNLESGEQLSLPLEDALRRLKVDQRPV